MSRPPCAAVVALLALTCCLFVHSSSASDDTPPSPSGLRVLQEMEAPLAYLGANDQVVAAVAGEVGDVVSGRRMELGLEDYPGSGANDRHSPWWQQRRN